MSGVTDGKTARRKAIALVAHEGKRDELRRLARRHHTILRRFPLLSTRADGQMLDRDCLLSVERTSQGILGDDLEIAARVVDGAVLAVIFLRDPHPTAPQDPNPHTLLRVCDAEGVPMATNTAAAEVILHFLRLHGDAPAAHLEPAR